VRSQNQKAGLRGISDRPFCFLRTTQICLRKPADPKRGCGPFLCQTEILKSCKEFFVDTFDAVEIFRFHLGSALNMPGARDVKSFLASEEFSQAGEIIRPAISRD
jgi:hypothetical protein